MLFNALFLAALKAGGVIVIWSKLPPRLRNLMKKHALLTDLSLAITCYMLLGGTLTALVAGAELGLIASLLLHIANNREKYNGLIAAGEWMMVRSSEIIQQANDSLLQMFGSKTLPSAEAVVVAA